MNQRIWDNFLNERDKAVFAAAGHHGPSIDITEFAFLSSEGLCTRIAGFWSKGRVFGQARITHESSRRRSITGRR